MPSLRVDDGTKDKAQAFLLVTACVVAGYIILSKIIFPAARLLLPFLAAAVAAWAAQRPIRFFRRRFGLPRWLASAVVLSLLLAAVGGGLYYGLSKAAAEGAALAAVLPQVLERLTEQWALAREGLPQWLAQAAEGLLSNSVQALGSRVSALAVTAMGLPDLLFSVVTFLVAAYFISSGFDRISAGLISLLPPKGRKMLWLFKGCFAEGILRYLKGLALLLCINFALLWAGFLWMGMQYAFVPALFTAAFDALPFVGTGGILIPWAVFEIALGNVENGTMLLIIFGVCAIVRQLAEPKVMGHALGLPPVASLMAVYVGYKIGGIWGMVLAPVALQICAQLYLTFKTFKGRNYNVL